MKHLTIIFLGLGLLVSMLHNTSIHGMELRMKKWVQSDIETFRDKTMLSFLCQKNDPCEKMQRKLHYLTNGKRYLQQKRTKQKKDEEAFYCSCFVLPFYNEENSKKKEIYKSKLSIMNSIMKNLDERIRKEKRKFFKKLNEEYYQLAKGYKEEKECQRKIHYPNKQ